MSSILSILPGRRRPGRSRYNGSPTIWRWATMAVRLCPDFRARACIPYRLSLYRLNHWLPRCQAHPEVVQGTAEFHHQIADACFPQADPIFDDAAALDTTVDMLDPQPTLVQRLVRSVLRQREIFAAWLLGRHGD